MPALTRRALGLLVPSGILDLRGGQGPRGGAYELAADEQAVPAAQPGTLGDSATVTAAGSTTPRAIADWFADSVNVRAFGARGDGSDDSAAIQAAIDFAWTQGKDLGWINNGPNLGGIVIELAGGEYTLGTPISLPAAGGGNLVIRNGTLRAGESFRPDRHILEIKAAGSVWHSNIKLENLVIDAGHRGGCLALQHYTGVFVRSCEFLRYATHGIKTIAPGGELLVTDCIFQEYIYGEPNWNVPDVQTGTAMELGSSDNQVTGCIVAYGKYGIRFAAGGNYMRGCHLYGLDGWAFHGTAQNIEIDGNYFDDPCQVVLEQVYEVRFTNNKIRIGASGPRAWLLRLFPQKGQGFPHFVCTQNGFVGAAYSPRGALTLSATTKGTGRTLTVSTDYASAAMLGSVIRERNSGTGVAVVTGHTGPTQITVRILTPFSATRIEAGDWTHVANSIWVDESVASYSPDLVGTVVAQNTFAGCQPRYTTVRRNFAIAEASRGELEFGDLIVVPDSVTDGDFILKEGTVGSGFWRSKLLYARGSVLAWHTDSAFTGTIAATAYTARDATG